MKDLRVKRIYEDAAPQDGLRMLVDRLWPRGISKERAALHAWAKELAPSDALRRAIHHEDMPFEQFEAAYLKELNESDAARATAQAWKPLLKQQPITLLYAAHDAQRNQAGILREWLLQQMGEEGA